MYWNDHRNFILYGSKWDLEKQEYSDKIELPEGVLFSTEHMSDLTACANCGKKIEYGLSYTSKEWYTPNGVFGLPVCEDCYREEWVRIIRHGEKLAEADKDSTKAKGNQLKLGGIHRHEGSRHMTMAKIINKQDLEELREWEDDRYGHEEYLQEDIEEINNFIEDPMLEELDRERLQNMLISFLKATSR